jgi:hypothetical protein
LLDDERLLARQQAVEQVLEIGHAGVDEDDVVGVIGGHSLTPSFGDVAGDAVELRRARTPNRAVKPL